MSDLRQPDNRQQRADGRRSRIAILESSVALLGRRPEASMEEIAMAAGVSRQTVYAHYPSRENLLRAVTRHVTAEVVRELDDLDVDTGSAVGALERWLNAGWSLLARYPVLMTPALLAPHDADEVALHQPITGGLIRVIERGRRRRELDRTMPTAWYVAAIIGLGHAAGQEVTAGRMTVARAGAAFRESVLRICRAPQ